MNSSTGVSFVCLLFLFFPLTSSLDCECGITNGNKRILYGKKVLDNKYPWVVYLQMRDAIKDEWGACTGSVINDQFILTAAHCVEHSKKLSDIQVFLTTSCNKKATANGEPLEVADFMKHYLYGSVGGGYDIALIKLKKRLNFNSNFRPVCLYNGNAPDNLFVSGWGLTNFGFILRESNCLLETELEQVTNNRCPSSYGYVNHDYVMCAGSRKTICFGDSGGPMTTLDGANVYQVGITSFTNRNCQLLDFGPAAFERVVKHKEWIEENTRGAGWCTAPKQLIS